MTKSINIFCAYAHNDKRFRDGIARHLNRNFIAKWYDREIEVDNEERKQIDAHLNTSHIILLLISVDFIASDYCYGMEMKHALERHEAGTASIIPIIVRSVDWQGAPFSKLQVLPTYGKPVSSWTNADEAFQDIARGIQQVMKIIIKQQYMLDAETAMKNQQYKSALVAYEEALQLGPDDSALYEAKATTLYILGSIDEALATYQQAIKLKPESASVWRGRGQALVSMDRFSEALDAYEHATGLEPDNPYLSKEKGDVFYQLMKWDEALSCYEKAIHLKPDFSSAYLDISRVYDKLAQQNYDKLKQLAKKANEAREKAKTSTDSHDQ